MNFIFFENNQIVLRKGCENDSENIAELIYSSGSEAFNFMHFNKENVLKYIKYEFRTKIPSFFGNTYSWVGEDKQGNIISSAISYSREQYYLMTCGTIIKIICFYKFKSFKVLKRLSMMGQLVTPPKKNKWFLSCLAVSPNFRGNGLGESIIKQQMKWAKENGYVIYALDVSEKNQRAKMLYERIGLKVTKHKISVTTKVTNCYKMEILV